MTIEKQIDGTKYSIKLIGRLDTTTAPMLEAEFNENIAGKDYLYIDFAQLDYVSSAGLRMLLYAQKIMNKQGKMEIANVNPSVMEVLEITGFTDVLTII